MIKKRFLILTFIFTLCFHITPQANALNKMMYRNKTHQQKIAFIMYHMISEIPQYVNTYCITPKALEEDIVYLKNNNYVFSFVSEIEKVSRENPDKNIAVLTFDDGYESDFKYVLPLLKKHNAKATFFVFSSMLGEPFYMTENQLKKLADSSFTEIGNHSYDIHNKTLSEIKLLYSLSNNLRYIEEDFLKNKTALERIIKKPVTSLSYPNGTYTLMIDNILKQKNICKISVSTAEIPYKAYSRVIGRYNRSDERSVSDIVKLIK